MDCKEKSYEGGLAINREEAIKLWNISSQLVGNLTPISPDESLEDNGNLKWTYVGRKHRTAL